MGGEEGKGESTKGKGEEGKMRGRERKGEGEFVPCPSEKKRKVGGYSVCGLVGSVSTERVQRSDDRSEAD